MLPMLWEPVRPSLITWREYWRYFLFFALSYPEAILKTQLNWGGVEKVELGLGGGGMGRDGKDGGNQSILLTCKERNDMTSLCLNIALCQLGLLKYFEIEHQSNKYKIIRYHSDTCCALSLLELL